MIRIGRTLGVAAIALVALAVALAAPSGPGPGGCASAQSPRPSAAPPAAPQPAAAQPAGAPATAQVPAAQASPAQGGASGKAAPGTLPKLKLPQIEGDYDIDELRRLIELARESGFTDEQLRDITVEDEKGNVVKAWEFLEAHDRRQKEEAARIAAEQSKVYLAPKDILKELDKKQPKDLGQLRDKMLFVE